MRDNTPPLEIIFEFDKYEIINPFPLATKITRESYNPGAAFSPKRETS